MMFLCKETLLFCLFACVNMEEPHCSKYDFEEKVLEKMVRMEFQMERMRSEMDQSVKSVENIKQDIVTALESLKTKLEKYDKKVEQMEALGVELSKKLDTKQQVYEKILEQRLSVLENKTIKTVDEKMKDLEVFRENLITPTIAFKARLDSDSAAPSGHTFVFSIELFNHLGAYDSTSGKFTAPENGTYLFSMAFCIFNNNYLIVGIMVDGIKYTTTLFYSSSGNPCSTADTVAVLKAGQVVWVEALPGGSSGTIIDHEDSYRWNTFSGVLIHK